MTDADESLRRLFVPAARAKDDRLEIEDREQTPGGFVISRGARVVSVIERLERHGHITHRQGAAGRMLYADWSVGILGARDRDAATGCSGCTGYLDHQIDAARRYREIRAAVGGRLWPYAFAACCEDVTMQDFARHRGINATSATAVLRIALDSVADAYGMD